MSELPEDVWRALDRAFRRAFPNPAALANALEAVRHEQRRAGEEVAALERMWATAPRSQDA